MPLEKRGIEQAASAPDEAPSKRSKACVAVDKVKTLLSQAADIMHVGDIDEGKIDESLLLESNGELLPPSEAIARIRDILDRALPL